MTRRTHLRLLLAGAVAAVFVAPVVAQNVSNEAWIGQLGAGNTLDIVQEGRSNSAGADNIYLLLSQQGVGNSLVLLQSGYANKVGTLFGDEVDYARGVWQTGDINSINISQSNTALAGANTIGAVQQWSRANIIGLGANFLSVIQSDANGLDGTANNYIGRLVQANLTGEANNIADVVQAGGGLNAGNILANLYQRGTGNTFALTQTGQSNQLGETIRLGGVWQIGSGSEAYLVQDGERNLVEYVEQSGESNIVRLRQSGDRNAIASIDQDSVGFGEEGNLLSIVISGEDNGGTGSGAVGDFLMVNTMKQPGILQGVFRQYGGDNEASLSITGGAESRYGLTQDGDHCRAKPRRQCQRAGHATGQRAQHGSECRCRRNGRRHADRQEQQYRHADGASRHDSELVDRAGPSGTVNSAQTTELALAEGESSTSATMSVNVPAAHTARATLRLTLDGALVFETTEVYP